MSVHISAAVWRCKMSGTKKLVLLKLADQANDAGTECYPSVPRMVAECGVARGTVQRMLRELKLAGIIDEQYPPNTRVGDQFRSQATYRINLDALPPPAYRPKRKRQAPQATVERGPHGEAPSSIEAVSASTVTETAARPALAAESPRAEGGPHGEARSTMEPASLESEGGLMVRQGGPHGEAQSVLNPSNNSSPPYPPTTSIAARSTDPSLGPGPVSDRSSVANGGAQTTEPARRSGPSPVGESQEARQGGAGGELGVIPDWLEPRRHAGVALAEVERFRRILAGGLRRFGEAGMRSWFSGLELVSLSGTEAILGAGSYQATQLATVFGDWLQAELGVRPRFVGKTLPPLAPSPAIPASPPHAGPHAGDGDRVPERRRRRA